jgi:hypothetical protein
LYLDFDTKKFYFHFLLLTLVKIPVFNLGIIRGRQTIALSDKVTVETARPKKHARDGNQEK